MGNAVSPLWQDSNDRGKIQICPRCEEIDFVTIFHPQRSPPNHGRFLLALDTPQHDADCSVCRLLGALVLDVHLQESDGYHLRIFSAAKLFVGSERAKRKDPAVALIVIPGNWKGELPENMREQCFDSSFALIKSIDGRRYRAAEPRTAVKGTSVTFDRVNYQQIKSCLKECRNLHRRGKCYYNEDRQRQPSIPLKCIDCNSRAIVEIEEKDEYLALSYVWGGTAAPAMTKEGLVPEPTSQVIEDAMKIVRGLGKRYLWVDQYSVDQKNHDIKDVQIGEMDLIYANALVTIVAAAGSDATYGLPGVSRARLHKQVSINVKDLEICSTLPSLPFAIKDSVWLRRGWTYQEAVLSRRCIFFTEYQTYFVCRGMSRREAVVVHPPKGWPKYERRSLDDMDTFDTTMFQRGPRSVHGGPLREFTNHIVAYSSRNLTYEEDVLPAFSGLLSRANFSAFCGIPVSARYTGWRHTEGVTFAIGLWWHPSRSAVTLGFINLKRREHFPSWTWAGWKGSVEYPGEHGMSKRGSPDKFMEVNDATFDTRFMLDSLEHSHSTLSKAMDGKFGELVVLSPTLHTLVIQAKVFSLRFQLKQGSHTQLCLCKCHPQAKHAGQVAASDWWQDAVFLEQLEVGDKRYQQMLKKQWDCVLLFESTLQYQCLIITEQVGDKHYRVGNLQIQGREKLHSLRSTERRVRIG